MSLADELLADLDDMGGDVEEEADVQVCVGPTGRLDNLHQRFELLE